MRSLLLVITALLFGLQAPQQAEAQGTYRIKPGDVLEISVLEDSNLNRQVLVRPDGGISMPIAGNIKAGGNSISAVERVITERLKDGFSITPTVSVALARLAEPADPERGKIEIYVMGEVAAPGERRVKRRSTILQALAQAGGLTKFAAEKRIQLRRTNRAGQETIFIFDYDAVERGARIETNVRVQPGDIIVVPERRLFE